MTMRTRNHSGILLLAAFFIFAAPAAGHADNLFRLYPELAASGIYSDNIPLRSSNGEGDFAGDTGRRLFSGLHLGCQIHARYTTILSPSYSRTNPGMIGLGKHSILTRPTLKICHRRPSCASMNSSTAIRPGRVASLLSTTQAPLFDTVAYQLLLANDQTSINWVAADLTARMGAQLVQRSRGSSGDLFPDRQQRRRQQ